MKGMNKMNSLQTIWRAPRQTLRAKLIEGVEWKAFLLIVASGFMVSFAQVAFTPEEEGFALLPGFGIVLLGVVAAVIGWYVLSGLLHFIARLFGGTGTYKGTRFAYAYGQIPYTVVTAILLLPTLFILKENTFMLDEVLTNTQQNWRMIAASIYAIFAIWSVITTIFTVAEAQQFSAWRSLFTFITMFIILIVLIVAIVFILTLLGMFVFMM